MRGYRFRRDQQISLYRGLPSAKAGARQKAVGQLLVAGGAQRQASVSNGTLSPVFASAQWNPLGPAPLSNGQTFGGVTNPVSGRVTAIAIKPTDPNVVYVGTANGGVYRTLDGGSTWTPIFDSAATLAIGSLAIAPSSPTTLYVGTGEGNGSIDSFFGVGIYRVDNAETTATLTGPLNPGNVFTGVSVSKILVDPANAGRIFASTTYGVSGKSASFPQTIAARGAFRSDNATGAANAVTFTKLTVATENGGADNVSDMMFEPGNANNLLVYVVGSSNPGGGGLWRSTNALASDPTTVTFTRTLSGPWYARGALDINKNGTTITVILATDEASGTVRESTDGGQTFPTTLTGAAGFCDGQCWYDIVARFDPTSTQNLLLGGVHVYRSTDGGTTIAESDTGLHADTHAIEFAPSNASIVYTGDDGGIFKSTDGGNSWTSLNNSQFSATQFESLAVHPTDPNFTIGGTQDNGTPFLQPDNTWTRADFGDGGFSLIDNNATDTTNVTMYHTYFNETGQLIGFGRVTNTANAHDGGWDFRGCNQGSSNNGIGCTDSTLFYAPMALGPGNPQTLYFGTDRLYRSTDRGDTMNVVTQPFGARVSSIAIAAQNDNVRLVGLQNGRVFRTTTGASTLDDITGPWPALYIAHLSVDPTNADVAYVTLDGYSGASNHIWRTTNLSSATPTWASISNGVPDVPVNAFAINPTDSNKLVAGTDIGVFASSDGGNSWSPLGSGLPVVPVFDMSFVNNTQLLRIATHGRGLWQIQLGEPTTLTTSLTGGGSSGALISVLPNTPVTDSATLAGTAASTATGTVTYNVYSDAGCTQLVNQGTAENIITPGTLPGSQPVTVSTPGNYYWQATYSGDRVNLRATSNCGDEIETVLQPLAAGAFLVGDISAGNLSVGTTLNFWGAQWAKTNKLSGGPAPASLKGFTDSPTVPACGTNWSTAPGNSAGPPGTLPSQIVVIVTTKATKNGATFSGDTTHLLLVNVGPGYGPAPGQRGNGTIAAVIC